MTEDPGSADSAGVPWAGRRFAENPAAGDDGSADPALADAVRRFRAGGAGLGAVVDALRQARLLIPLLAVAGDEGVGAHGQRVDKTQELSIVTVAAPDGRRALPVFGSVAAMAAWDPSARPIPSDARRVGIAAASEGTPLVVLDPGAADAVVLRPSALRALGLGTAWQSPADDPRVGSAVESAAADDPRVLAVRPIAGDPHARLDGPDVIVAVVLRDGLDPAERGAVLDALARRCGADPVLADLVDTLAVSVVS